MFWHLDFETFSLKLICNILVNCSVVVQSSSEAFLVKFCDIISKLIFWKPRGQGNWSIGTDSKCISFREARWTWFSNWENGLEYICCTYFSHLNFNFSWCLQPIWKYQSKIGWQYKIIVTKFWFSIFRFQDKPLITWNVTCTKV